jgi:hypothetical protein
MIDETLAGARQPKAAARCERAPARSAEGRFKRQRDRGAGWILSRRSDWKSPPQARRSAHWDRVRSNSSDPGAVALGAFATLADAGAAF